jgi:hypothetical protein
MLEIILKTMLEIAILFGIVTIFLLIVIPLCLMPFDAYKARKRRKLIRTHRSRYGGRVYMSRHGAQKRRQQRTEAFKVIEEIFSESR